MIVKLVKSNRTVQGLKVETLNKKLGNTTYVVYQDKIWAEVGSQGSGINFCRKLERKENGCSIVKWIHGDEHKNVEFISSPTGYINLDELGKVQPIHKLEYLAFIDEIFSNTIKDTIGKYFCQKFNIDNEELSKADKNVALEIIARYVEF